MSGSGSNLPVRITVEGGAQAEAAFNRVAATGERAMQTVTNSTTQAASSGNNLRYVVGQAGYQVQDFAVQVQGGTSALTALSQQGSQLLGVFGPAGAIAGAVLTVGILASQLLTAKTEAENTSTAVDAMAQAMAKAAADGARLAEMMARVEGRFLSMQAAAEQQRRRAITADVQELGRLENDARLRALNADIAARQAANEAASMRGQLAPEYGLSFSDQEGLRLRIRELEGRAESERGNAAAARAELERFSTNRISTAGLLTGEPSGADRDAAEALRRSLDDRYRINQEYEEKVADLRRRAAQGLLPDGEIGNLEVQAARRRNEALARLDRQPGGGASVDRSDPSGAVDRIRDQRALSLQREIDQLTRNVETPIERYQRRLEQLTEVTLRARSEGNPIPDEAIRRSKDAVLADFERLEQGAERSSNMGRELGMTFSSAFEDAIVKGKSFSDILKGIEQDIARIIIRQTITAPLGNAISGAVKGFDFSSIFTNLFTGKADGGPVNGGQTYLVGERGPELFTPGASGNITPNHAMGGMGNITYAPTIHVDARGSDANTLARARIEAQAISQATIAQFADSIQRGGAAARLVGRR
jgi:hypothetical protein